MKKDLEPPRPSAARAAAARARALDSKNGDAGSLRYSCCCASAAWATGTAQVAAVTCAAAARAASCDIRLWSLHPAVLRPHQLADPPDARFFPSAAPADSSSPLAARLREQCRCASKRAPRHIRHRLTPAAHRRIGVRTGAIHACWQESGAQPAATWAAWHRRQQNGYLRSRLLQLRRSKIRA